MSADFRGKGASPTNHCWCQKTRVIAVSCGIKTFAVRCLVLSQYMHLTDRRTDGQNCDSNTVRCITCSRTVKIKRKSELRCVTFKFCHQYFRFNLPALASNCDAPVCSASGQSKLHMFSSISPTRISQIHLNLSEPDDLTLLATARNTKNA